MQINEKVKRPVVNRLNDLDSRQWLKFQKSWFINHEDIYSEFLSFFTKEKKASGDKSIVASFGENGANVKSAVETLGRRYYDLLTGGESTEEIDYAIIDLRNHFNSEEEFADFWHKHFETFRDAFARLGHRKYLTVLVENIYTESKTIPIAWWIATELAKIFTLKDEKIACNNGAETGNKKIYYCLNFRKDEQSGKSVFLNYPNHAFSANRIELENQKNFFQEQWFIPKPPPREKNVLLHPAKYPETMVEDFIKVFSPEGGKIIDPMLGTGSTLMACVNTERNGYGIELNPTYKEIARQRITKAAEQASNQLSEYFVACGNAADPLSYKDIPENLDYCITSPPYWDMLNMKGAETQKSRRQKGYDVSYSDREEDLGNVRDYQEFLEKLRDVYLLVKEKLKSGGYLTIIVKNVKKKGIIYPLAWDLTRLLAQDFYVLPEKFWCQDDITIAPYGYGNAWVSNTFHHYCLTFQKT